MHGTETTPRPARSDLAPADLDRCGGGQRRTTPIKTFRCPSDPRVVGEEALRLAGGGLPRPDPEWKYVPVRR